MDIKTIEDAMKAVQVNSFALRTIPNSFKTPAVCEIAVEKSGWVLKYVPNQLKTPELCRTAVLQSGEALEYVPDELKTSELCLEAVMQNGTALEWVPDKIKTPNICMAAVQDNGVAINWVPQAMRTPDICGVAVRDAPIALQSVPEECKTLAMCMDAVRRDAQLLRSVPEALKTKELCAVALQSAVNGRHAILQFLPDAFKTPEVCLTAIKQHADMLEFVPDALKTEEMCMVAVRNNGSMLEFVPEKMRTLAICTEAMRFNAGDNALAFVPDKLKTESLCFAAVKNNGGALQYVPDGLKNRRMCMAACRREPTMLSCVPEAVLTESFCRELVKTHGEALQYIPERLRTQKVCETACADQHEAWIHVPQNLLTEQIVYSGIVAGARSYDSKSRLSLIPDRLWTENVQHAVLKAYGANGFELLPEKFQNASTAAVAAYEEWRGGTQNGSIEKAHVFLASLPAGVAKDIPGQAIKNNFPVEVLPLSMRTPEVAASCMFYKLNEWDDLPEASKTPDAASNYLSCFGKVAWEHLPQEYRTPSVAEAAICMATERGSYHRPVDIFLDAVQPEDRTPKMCRAILLYESSDSEAITEAAKRLPTNAWTAKLAQAAACCSDAFKYVPDSLKTHELCINAVSNDGMALEFVPEKLKTPELCLEAVKSECFALEFVPARMQTEEMATTALAKSIHYHYIRNTDQVLDMLGPQFFLADGKTIDPARTTLLKPLLGRDDCFPEHAGCIPQAAGSEDRLLELVRAGCGIDEAFRTFGGAQDGALPKWATERVLLAFEAAGKGLMDEFDFRWGGKADRPSPESVPDSVYALGAMMHMAKGEHRPGVREAAERMFPQAFVDAGLAPEQAEEEGTGPRL